MCMTSPTGTPHTCVLSGSSDQSQLSGSWPSTTYLTVSPVARVKLSNQSRMVVTVLLLLSRHSQEQVDDDRRSGQAQQGGRPEPEHEHEPGASCGEQGVGHTVTVGHAAPSGVRTRRTKSGSWVKSCMVSSL